MGARWEDLVGPTPALPAERGRGLVWFGQRGMDAATLGAAGNVRAIVCCDWGDELREVSKTIPVVSVERESGRREVWASASLASIPAERMREAIAGAAAEGPAVVVPYRTTKACEAAVRRLPGRRVTLAGPASGVVDRLDDKRVQRRLFARWGLPIPRWALIRLEELRIDRRRVAGVPLPAIVQHPRSSLGKQTFLVSSAADVTNLRGRWDPAVEFVVSQFIAGPVVNTTAVVTPDAVHVAWPSVQMVGLPWCAPADCPFAYCGNDFSAAADLPEAVLDRLFALKRELGEALRGERYRGLFGADWIFDGDAWYLLEVNPRFQGSTLLLSILEAEAGLPTSVMEHVRAFAGQPPESERGRPPRPQPLKGAHVVLYQREAYAVRAGRPPGAPDPSAEPRTDGVRSWSPWTVVGAPMADTEVVPGAILGRLVSRERVLGSTLVLTLGAAEAVELAYRALRI